MKKGWNIRKRGVIIVNITSKVYNSISFVIFSTLLVIQINIGKQSYVIWNPEKDIHFMEFYF